MMWPTGRVVRMLVRYTVFVLVPLSVAVWLVSVSRGENFPDLLYKALLALIVLLVLLVTLVGWSGFSERNWEASMVGRLPGGSGERMTAGRAGRDISIVFATRAGIAGLYTAVVMILLYAVSH